MIGTTFAGFSVLEKISHGGMADIYLVTDRRGQQFALRVLLPEFRYQWERVRQFRFGCQVLSALDHPNIALCHDSGKFEGFQYAVLEYVEGSNLKEQILRNDPLLRTHRLRLLHGMAAGLAHIHEHGYLHLDFKPENVLIPRTYEPKLIDFDLAVERPDKPKRLTSRSGTLSYWAPEQILRQPVDERADIFAYGVTAYEMITGKKPITGDTRKEILEKYAHFNEYLKPLRTHVPDLPQYLQRVILKCLEKDVARRYPSLSLVLRDLQI